MTVKPSTAPFHWATGSPAYRSPDPIPSGRQDTGLQNGDPSDPLAFNSLLGNVTDWTVYLGQFAVSTGVDYRVEFQVWDSVGGSHVGSLKASSGNVVLEGADAGDPAIYLRRSAENIWFQIGGVNSAILINGGWDLNNLDFRLGFGDTVGDGSGYPTYTWDRSPAFGSGWVVTSANAAKATDVALYITPDAGPAGDTAHMENETGGSDTLRGRCMLAMPLAVNEDGAIARWTVTELVVVFAGDTAAQPTVSLIRATRDGANTRTTMASCQPTAAASRQTITDNTISSADLDWSTYVYFLEWLESSIADAGFSRGVEQVLVRVRTRAGA